tara:strand:+ start:1504 stop:2370 length:867 start_codon:yes stop_codon:yes gene_type:complete
MPIPKPTGTESEDEFMGRCMASPVMQDEYADTEKRTAICLGSFRDNKKGEPMIQDEIAEQEEKTTPQKSQTEFKYLDVPLEIKMPNEEDGIFSGYASIFGNKDLGNDIVQKGAFLKSLGKKRPKQIKMLFQHKTDEPIGIYKKIEEDEKGLYVEGQLAMGTQRGREVHELMKMGAIDGLSIGYKMDGDGYEWNNGGDRRKLKEIDLMEISAVTFPMNPKARVRKVKGTEITIREWEEVLRDVGGLSRTESKIAAKAVTKALGQRDVEEDKPEIINAINNLTKLLQGDK